MSQNIKVRNIHNENLIIYEKNLKNRINRKYGKVLKNISKTDLQFDNLNDEIKFLNQLYFLHQSIQNVEANLEGVIEILNNVKNKEPIKKDFKEEISDDNWHREIIKKMVPLVFM
jgi:hypothetical protein